VGVGSISGGLGLAHRLSGQLNTPPAPNREPGHSIRHRHQRHAAPAPPLTQCAQAASGEAPHRGEPHRIGTDEMACNEVPDIVEDARACR